MTDLILGFSSQYESYVEFENRKKLAQDKDNGNLYSLFDHKQTELLEEFNEKIFKIKLSLKHESYESEKEIRLILSQNEYERTSVDFRDSKSGILIEYICIKLILDEDLKNIRCHPLSNDLQIEGMKRFLKSKEIENIDDKVSKSNIPFRIV